MTRRQGYPIVLCEVVTTRGGEIVRARRLELGLTYDEAAKRCHLNPWNIQDVERGKSKDTGARVILGLSRGLGIPLDVLTEALAANGDAPTEAA